MDAIEQTLTTDLTRAVEAADAAGLTAPSIDRVRAAVERRHRQRRLRTGLLVAAAVVVVAGTVAGLTAGDGSRTEIGNDPAPTTVPPTPAPSTTEPTTPSTIAPVTVTTTPSTTTSAPTPTRGRVAESIPLRAQGIGTFEFGAANADAPAVTAAISAELGAPTSEVPPFEPPLPPCIGRVDPLWRVASESEWDGLVVWFAGPDAATQYLVGYRAANRAPTRPQDANPTVRMAGGPALTDPLEMWMEAYGSAMVDRNEGDPTVGRTFDIQLADGLVRAHQYSATGETARVWSVSAGASCDDAG